MPRQADTDTAILDKIAELMNGVEWSPDTLDDIAHLVRQSGRSVEDSGEFLPGAGD